MMDSQENALNQGNLEKEQKVETSTAQVEDAAKKVYTTKKEILTKE